MSDDSILKSVNRYYTGKVFEHGPTPRGVDWNSEDSQRLRFQQLLKLCEEDSDFSIIDYGCGYGALLQHLRDRKIPCRYVGFDISPQMLEQAAELTRESKTIRYVHDENELSAADYTVASGVFNVKLRHSQRQWEGYVSGLIEGFDRLSEKGFAFNMLTRYCDSDKTRDDLFYADPCFYFDLCQRLFSRNVTLLHDYDLYEFTLLVRKK